MLNYENQLNLGNIYSDCKEMFKEQRPEFLDLLDKYIDINSYIPFSFKNTFYSDTERHRGCSLYGYISMLSYDTSAVEFYVTENNPKYLNSTINRLKTYYGINGIDKTTDDIYKQAFIPLNSRATSDKPNCPINGKRYFSMP